MCKPTQNEPCFDFVNQKSTKLKSGTMKRCTQFDACNVYILFNMLCDHQKSRYQ